MIVITYKMKDTMNYYSIELFLEFCSVLLSILSDRINTYEEIARKTITFAIIESDDISEIVMLEIFLVYISYIVVRTEDDGDVSDLSDFTLRNES